MSATSAIGPPVTSLIDFHAHSHAGAAISTARASTAAAAPEEINDEIVAWVEHWPDRYRGLATLPLEDVESALSELERSQVDLGLTGIAVGTSVVAEDWDSPRHIPELEAAQELHAVVFSDLVSHRIPASVGRSYHLVNTISNRFETTSAIARLIFREVVDAFPDLRKLFVHGGVLRGQLSVGRTMGIR